MILHKDHSTHLHMALVVATPKPFVSNTYNLYIPVTVLLITVYQLTLLQIAAIAEFFRSSTNLGRGLLALTETLIDSL